uniref:Vegetative cell wall protein gp1-like n=1 Tax=Steinernema glaseri TaxID=37863 RepID=A0A1I7YRX4_9BILA
MDGLQRDAKRKCCDVESCGTTIPSGFPTPNPTEPTEIIPSISLETTPSSSEGPSSAVPSSPGTPESNSSPTSMPPMTQSPNTPRLSSIVPNSPAIMSNTAGSNSSPVSMPPITASPTSGRTFSGFPSSPASSSIPISGSPASHIPETTINPMSTPSATTYPSC